MRWWMPVGLVLCVAVGCGEAGKSPVTESTAPSVENVETTAAAFNVEGAPTVEFSVPDMMCAESCAPTVRKILAAQPGVKDVEVDLDSKRATVAVDEDAFDADKAIAALVDMQFKQTTLAGDAEAAKN